jgi:spermidine dehydrogenase
MNKRDKTLGMGKPISRRDFIQGMAVAAGAGLGLTGCRFTGSGESALLAHPPGNYPPAKTGLRGNHDGSWEVAHELRDGARFDQATPTGQHYDLVVVGGGISGLSAAWFYRQRAGTDARILILDNHDDFGGHARRNEFEVDGRTIIGYGGSESIDTPSSYSTVSARLLIDLGIDIDRFYDLFDQELYSRLGMGGGDFFSAEHNGSDLLVAKGSLSLAEHVARFPMATADHNALIDLLENPRREFNDLGLDERLGLLATTSYHDYLTGHLSVPRGAAAYLADMPRDYFGIGADGLTALAAMESGFPGFVNLLGDEHEDEEEEPYIFHFPDGNAGIARALVQQLIPASTSASGMDELATARFDYQRLDETASAVRLRLNSTAVRVQNRDDGVAIDYVRGQATEQVTANHAVLACWNTVIPYLCPELPSEQRQALAHAVKVPLLYAHVCVRNFRAWQEMGVHEVYCPGAFFSHVALNFPVSLGGYRFARSADDPVMIHMVRAPAMAGLPAALQFRTGRAQILGTPFEIYEREIRSQLQRMFGPAGFEASRDIAAITLNRWPHGYAWEYVYAGEPTWEENQRPDAIGRQTFGNISIANSDAAGRAYADAAIDQAHRAVNELIGQHVRSA